MLHLLQARGEKRQLHRRWHLAGIRLAAILQIFSRFIYFPDCFQIFSRYKYSCYIELLIQSQSSWFISLIYKLLYGFSSILLDFVFNKLSKTTIYFSHIAGIWPTAISQIFSRLYFPDRYFQLHWGWVVKHQLKNPSVTVVLQPPPSLAFWETNNYLLDESVQSNYLFFSFSKE